MSTNAHSDAGPEPRGEPSTGTDAGPPPEMNHVVQFYEDDGFLVDTVARFIGGGLAAGEPVVIIATDLHRHALVQRLKANDFDVERACVAGHLTLVDAHEALSQFMVDDLPDGERFRTFIGSLIESTRASHGGARVRAYGEMVDALWRDGNPQAALILEGLWNELGRQHAFSLLCAYRFGNFYKEADAPRFQQVCEAHSRVVPTEQYSNLEDTDARLREVSRLQQRARALETEIAQRKEVAEGLARMFSEQVKQSEQTEERFRLLVENVVDYAIFMLDPEGRVVNWNLGAERIKGYRAVEIIGQHFSRFYPEEDVRAGKCELELEVAAREGRFEDEDWRVRKDGRRFWANVIITALRRPDGTLVGFGKVTRDLTERKLAEERARALVREQTARAAAEARVQFGEKLLGIVSHDLRNPLNAITMAAAMLLQSEKVPARELRLAQRVSNSATRMARMLDQLIDLTRARLVGELGITRHEADLGKVCREAVEELALSNPERAIAFEAEGELRGVWDPDRLAQLISNLVGNALQHGAPKAPVTVRLEGRADAVHLQVHNEGAPIPEASLSTIFEPFRRANAADAAKNGNLGLGLYIAQQIALAHGTRIEVASSAAEGTTFRILLPRAVLD